MKSDDVVSVRGLSVAFGRRRVLDGLDLDVPLGSVMALVGRNGAGKSTLLRVLVGLLAPDAGELRVVGLDPVRHGARVRARVGYVADRFDVSSWMRVRDRLAFVASFHRTWSGEAQRRWLALLELDERAKVAELSKGGRAKLALVAALAHEPELLVLDEPFSGLDAPTRRATARAIVGSLGQGTRGALIVSHSLADLERLADRVAVVADGKIQRRGELETFALTPEGGIDLERELCGAQVGGGEG